ncbi:MAG: M3 family peptidase [Alphaproteobacteria bacterium]|nr:M3 family peptidase [Alphaproteobacteria bacterium]
MSNADAQTPVEIYNDMLKAAYELIEDIIANPEAPTVENTLGYLTTMENAVSDARLEAARLSLRTTFNSLQLAEQEIDNYDEALAALEKEQKKIKADQQTIETSYKVFMDSIRYRGALAARVEAAFAALPTGEREGLEAARERFSPNPLLETSPHKNFAPQFDKMQPEHFVAAALEAKQVAKANIEAIKNNAEAPTFQNTIEQIEFAHEELKVLYLTFENNMIALGGGYNDIAGKMGDTFPGYKNEVLADADLFARVKEVYETVDRATLSAEELTLLEATYSDFARNGALLGDAQKVRLKQLDKDILETGARYTANLVKARGAFEHYVTDEAELEGIPALKIQAMKQDAVEKGRPDAWRITLDAPVYGPVMVHAKNRALREYLWRAAGKLATEGDTNNEPVALKILKMRQERAELVGYKTHAHFVTAGRMSQNPETVMDFLENLKNNYRPAALQESAQIQEFARETDGLEDFQPWDSAYYAEKLKQKLFSFSSEELRPYLPLEKVMQGAFQHFSKQLDLRFEKNETYPVYHPDVTAYDVYDDETGAYKGILLSDPFPRQGKKGGAWATVYREGGMYKGEYHPPVVAICGNYTKPVGDKPALLAFGEANTNFHEMGHATHALCGTSKYPRLAGFNVFWDTVEHPSQFQENYLGEPETLAMVSGHFERPEEPLPLELIKKMDQAGTFMAATVGLRQVSIGTLDMMFYLNPARVAEMGLANFEKGVMQDFRTLTHTDELNLFGTQLNHIFSCVFTGDYAAGYNSYKWAEVMDATTFERMKATGNIYDPAMCRAFKRYLEAGGTRHQAELFRELTGGDPDPLALLRREGLAEEENPPCGAPNHVCQCVPS